MKKSKLIITIFVCYLTVYSLNVAVAQPSLKDIEKAILTLESLYKNNLITQNDYLPRKKKLIKAIMEYEELPFAVEEVDYNIYEKLRIMPSSKRI
ncbi:MAG: hypothetical protein AB1782_09415 [Cyanobacteriota bacterium]